MLRYWLSEEVVVERQLVEGEEELKLMVLLQVGVAEELILLIRLLPLPRQVNIQLLLGAVEVGEWGIIVELWVGILGLLVLLLFWLKAVEEGFILQLAEQVGLLLVE